MYPNYKNVHTTIVLQHQKTKLAKKTGAALAGKALAGSGVLKKGSTLVKALAGSALTGSALGGTAVLKKGTKLVKAPFRKVKTLFAGPLGKLLG